jgi:hypothetical protein
MIKLDPKQDLKHLYTAAKQPTVVDVPPLNYLMIDGSDDPNTAQIFKDGTQALYGDAYALKFMFKNQRGINYSVMPMEGLWWADNMAEFRLDDKSNWLWTLMLVLPEVVTAADFAQAVADVEAKKNPPALDQVRFAPYSEGLAAQILHIGSYEDEAPTIQHLHEFIEDQGYTLSGKHHEIYIGDPNRSAPETLKTIIRQPIRRKV